MKSITNVIPNNVVEKAIEGGWRDSGIRYRKVRAVTGSHMIPVEVAALDPTFWQALGKSLRWEDHGLKPSVWFYKAITFYEMILAGNDTDDFWKEILS